MTDSVSPKILVIEDEQAVREALVDSLTLEGYNVVWKVNGDDGVKAYEEEEPDLIILDVMMPGIDGLEVCRKIRQDERYIPIIILTAKSGEIDKVVGLELGADDYLTKPFGMRELFARVKALLRRTTVQAKPRSNPSENIAKDESLGIDAVDELAFSDVLIDFKAYRAKKGERTISLSAKEFELIKYLSKQPDIAISRDELLNHVWGYNSYPTTRTVDNFIARLRQKLEVAPEQPKHILTVHGVGYKFVNSIET